MKQGDIKRGNRNLRQRELKASQKDLFLQQWERQLEKAQEEYQATRPAILDALRELCVEIGMTTPQRDTDLAAFIRTDIIGWLRRERATHQARLEQAQDGIRRLLIATERAEPGPRSVPVAPPIAVAPPTPPPARVAPPAPSSSPPRQEPMLPPPISFNGFTASVDRVNQGYVSRCTCGWGGASWERMTGASQDCLRHLQRAHRTETSYGSPAPVRRDPDAEARRLRRLS